MVPAGKRLSWFARARHRSKGLDRHSLDNMWKLKERDTTALGFFFNRLWRIVFSKYLYSYIYDSTDKNFVLRFSWKVRENVIFAVAVFTREREWHCCKASYVLSFHWFPIILHIHDYQNSVMINSVYSVFMLPYKPVHKFRQT